MNIPRDRHILIWLKGSEFPVMGKFYESYVTHNGIAHDAWTTVAGVYSHWKPAKEEDIVSWMDLIKSPIDL